MTITNKKNLKITVHKVQVLMLFILTVNCLIVSANPDPINKPIEIEAPVVVNGTNGGIWNLDQHHLSFNARAVYTIGDGTINSDIYITTYSLWPRKMAVTKKYHILNADNVVFAPQFSPDGTKVLFDIGWPYESHGLYRMYLWDMKSNNVQEVSIPFTSVDKYVDTFKSKKARPLQFRFPIVHWSPNSQFLSYIRGGDIYGGYGNGDCLLDTFSLSGKERYYLAKNNALLYGYAWTPDNNILYSAIENSTIDIYRISPEAKNRKLILKNAYRPTTSQDGGKIAFFGPEHFETSIKLQDGYLDIRRPHGLSLTVANADGTNRKALNREDLYYPEVIWMPDNKHFLTIDPGTSYTSDNDKPTGKMTTTSKITLWDVETGRRKHICDIPAQDIEFIHRTDDEHQFTPLQLSPDGKTLFITVSEMINRGQYGYNQRLSVKAVDISSGKIYDIGHLSNVYDLQWRLEKPDLSSLKK